MVLMTPTSQMYSLSKREKNLITTSMLQPAFSMKKCNKMKEMGKTMITSKKMHSTPTMEETIMADTKEAIEEGTIITITEVTMIMQINRILNLKAIVDSVTNMVIKKQNARTNKTNAET